MKNKRSAEPRSRASPSPDQPDLAVVVIGLGAPPELVDAVQSVLAQSVPIEIVVVNSGGGDARRLLADAGIDVPVHETRERLYVGAARNLGIELTNAPWIAFLASDCRAAPNWAAERLRLHSGGEDMVASAMMPDRSDRVVAWAHHLLLFPLRLPGLSAEQAIRYGVSFDRGLFDAFGRFDETLRIGEDTDFLERTAVVGEPAWAPTVVTFHRSIESTRSLLRDQAIRGYRSANASGRYRDSPFRLAAESLRLPRTARRSARAALTGDERRLARSSLWLVRLGSLVRALGNLAALPGLRRLRLPRSVTARV